MWMESKILMYALQNHLFLLYVAVKIALNGLVLELFDTKI